ncbi:MAG: molecular chaperone HtpG, partial [Algicola sp.]|nr:molecular chaperone HtpG [Algicola sp.]
YDLRITLSVDATNHILYIEDNGSGLTYDEVINYLATIGQGYTRLFRDGKSGDGKSQDQNQASQMIGYFGLGFLSAYVVSDKVDVWTCSYQTPNLAWHFSSRGGKQFSIQQCDDGKPRGVGTLVKLQLSNEFSELASLDVLQTLLRQYCSLLPIDIYLKGDSEPVNNLSVPWRQDSAVSALQLRKQRMKFAELFEHNFNPICVIPIKKDNAAGVNGLIWIQDASGYATSDYRNVSVFIRNMYISQKERELLPLWAGFAGCVLESESLTPTASRESIQTDDAYRQVQHVLSETLIEGLKQIASGEPETWRRILRRHNQALMGAALNDDRLFDVLSDVIKVPTNMGEMTLPALLKQSDRRIYLRLEDKNSYEDILFKTRMIPVVSGFMFAGAGFCQKYATNFNLKVVHLGTKAGADEIFKTVTPAPGVGAFLKEQLGRKGDSICFTHFDPGFVPMVIVEDQQVKLKQRIEQDEADKRIGSAALSLAKLHTVKIDDTIQRQVFVNLNSPLIERLIALQSKPFEAATLANMLRSFMVIMCFDATDSTNNFGAELQRFGQSLLNLI